MHNKDILDDVFSSASWLKSHIKMQACFDASYSELKGIGLMGWEMAHVI